MKLLSIIICLFTFFILPNFFKNRPSSSEEPVAASVRISSWIELIFGLLVFFGGIVYSFFSHFSAETSFFIFSLFCLLGMLWMIMASRLSNGNYQARKMFLILSAFRIFTIVGIPFYAASIFLLRKKVLKNQIPQSSNFPNIGNRM
jgi:hypothetical protein